MNEIPLTPAAVAQEVQMQWDVQIPLRDGIRLSAILYLPRRCTTSAPAILAMTPYTAQTFHEEALYFASRGYPFLSVDVRGRGNSEGVFWPFIHEARDAADVVEWVARQAYCNGQVAMRGGSYGGYMQWAAARELPPHLSTIVPTAAPYIGVDFPIRRNMAAPYWMQWLTLVWGRTLQGNLFWNNEAYWSAKFRAWFESGAPFKELDAHLGCRSAIFQEWASHPQRDDYWDACNPTAEQYAQLSIPVLTITGAYDGDQLGALEHFRKHLQHNPTAEHYLVIGPWDHAGTRTPQATFAGLNFGPESVIDLKRLHLEWYAWTMQHGPKPPFLERRIAYFVAGARTWRHAETLDAITSHHAEFFLRSKTNAVHLFESGALAREPAPESQPDEYTYDPRDVSIAPLEATSFAPLSMRPAFPTDELTDQKPVFASEGKQLVYHSAPFEENTEISGFFTLRLWLAIDQPDTDFRADLYEIDANGASVMLTTDSIRARYRTSLRQETLVDTTRPLPYDFERFTFVSRLILTGSRLRLVIGPVNSIHAEKNYNCGGVVAEECIRDARVVTVRLFHDRAHPSVLRVPLGHV